MGYAYNDSVAPEWEYHHIRIPTVVILFPNIRTHQLKLDSYYGNADYVTECNVTDYATAAG